MKHLCNCIKLVSDFKKEDFYLSYLDEENLPNSNDTLLRVDIKGLKDSERTTTECKEKYFKAFHKSGDSWYDLDDSRISHAVYCILWSTKFGGKCVFKSGRDFRGDTVLSPSFLFTKEVRQSDDSYWQQFQKEYHCIANFVIWQYPSPHRMGTGFRPYYDDLVRWTNKKQQNGDLRRFKPDFQFWQRTYYLDESTWRHLEEISEWDKDKMNDGDARLGKARDFWNKRASAMASALADIP